MSFQHIKDVARAELRKATLWIKVALLSALPWAKQIEDAVSARLTDLQPYLPENIYKFMGGAVVVAGILASVWRSHQAVKALQ